MKRYKSALEKRENRIIRTVVIVVVLLLTNFPPLNFFLLRNYTYSNYNGTFVFHEERLKAFPYNTRERSYGVFLNENHDLKDRQLYRTFKLRPLYFWEWREWIVHLDRFMLPYISEEQIQANRKREGLSSVKKKREIPKKKESEQKDSLP